MAALSWPGLHIAPDLTSRLGWEHLLSFQQKASGRAYGDLDNYPFIG
jgi:hypothetical protein